MADIESAAPMITDACLARERRQPQGWERVAGVARLSCGGTLAHDMIGNHPRGTLYKAVRRVGCVRHGQDVAVVSPNGGAM